MLNHLFPLQRILANTCGTQGLAKDNSADFSTIQAQTTVKVSFTEAVVEMEIISPTKQHCLASCSIARSVPTTVKTTVTPVPATEPTRALPGK